MLIEADRIAAVSHGRLEVDGASARVVEVDGATVLPGLGDAHTHISWPLDFVFDHAGVAEAPAAAHALDVAAVTRTFLESGYTLIVGAGVLQADDDVSARDAIERGLIAGPRIIPSGLMVAEQGRLGADDGLMDVVADAEELRDVVARQCDAGARAIKLFISGRRHRGRLSVRGRVHERRDAGGGGDRGRPLRRLHHRPRPGDRPAWPWPPAPACGLIHHACFLDDEALAALEARRDDVWVCPGLHYLYAMVSGHADPWGMTPERIEASGYRHELESQVEGLHRLVAAGIRIVSGGDFGHQWTHHGTYAAELQRYVELVGMTPVEAIHTATRNMGPLVGLELGQVREGGLADLVVVDGDPTTDITVLQDPPRRRAVIKDGRFAFVNPRVYP